MSDSTLYPLLLLLVALTFVLGIFVGHSNGYKIGQIDALTGKVYYCLEKQESFELAWQYHSEGCKR